MEIPEISRIFLLPFSFTFQKSSKKWEYGHVYQWFHQHLHGQLKDVTLNPTTVQLWFSTRLLPAHPLWEYTIHWNKLLVVYPIVYGPNEIGFMGLHIWSEPKWVVHAPLLRQSWTDPLLRSGWGTQAMVSPRVKSKMIIVFLIIFEFLCSLSNDF